MDGIPAGDQGGNSHAVKCGKWVQYRNPFTDKPDFTRSEPMDILKKYEEYATHSTDRTVNLPQVRRVGHGGYGMGRRPVVPAMDTRWYSQHLDLLVGPSHLG